MLQGDVLVCGTVNSSAVEKTTKDGNTFITFSVLVPIQGKDGSVCETIVHVSSPGDRKRAVKFVAGKSVQAQGRLTVRIKDGIVYYNVRCENEPIFISADTEYLIEGSMDFTGCIGKDGVTIRQDKKQRDFKLFRAFTSDRHVADNGEQKKEFLWVNFIYFRPKEDECLAAGKYVDVYGDLSLNVYKGKANIECSVKTVKEHKFDNTAKQIKGNS